MCVRGCVCVWACFLFVLCVCVCERVFYLFGVLFCGGWGIILVLLVLLVSLGLVHIAVKKYFKWRNYSTGLSHTASMYTLHLLLTCHLWYASLCTVILCVCVRVCAFIYIVCLCALFVCCWQSTYNNIHNNSCDALVICTMPSVSSFLSRLGWGCFRLQVQTEKVNTFSNF